MCLFWCELICGNNNRRSCNIHRLSPAWVSKECVIHVFGKCTPRYFYFDGPKKLSASRTVLVKWVAGPMQKFSASGRRTGGNFQHCLGVMPFARWIFAKISTNCTPNQHFLSSYFQQYFIDIYIISIICRYDPINKSHLYAALSYSTMPVSRKLFRVDRHCVGSWWAI